MKKSKIEELKELTIKLESCTTEKLEDNGFSEIAANEIKKGHNKLAIEIRKYIKKS